MLLHSDSFANIQPLHPTSLFNRRIRVLLLNKLQKGKEYFIWCAIIYDKMFLKDAISPRDKEAANVKLQLTRGPRN